MPRKRFSQHFLFDPSILRRMIDAAQVTSEDTVLEIGPGPGRLTRLLAESAGRVIAVEIDRDLHAKLKAELSGFPNLELVSGDILRYPLESITGPFKVVANVPYHISTPIIFRLLEHREHLVSMTLTLQREVAQRIAARPGGKDYGILSLMVQYHGRAVIKFPIPRGAFRPVPRVDSACLHVDILPEPAVAVRDPALFSRVVRTAFSTRRKTMLNALKQAFPDAETALNAAGVDPSRRPETLGMEEFGRIADCLAVHFENG
jgi:16S rRNA (adenine1518-N6/adenine1519-N6)-dimethyltransferase